MEQVIYAWKLLSADFPIPQLIVYNNKSYAQNLLKSSLLREQVLNLFNYEIAEEQKVAK